MSTMKMILYNMLLSVAALGLAPWYAWRVLVSGKYRKSTGPKLGFHPAHTLENLEGSPRIWIHAVSVGEVTAAAPILAKLRQMHPRGVLLLSTSTETGQEAARRLVPQASAIFYFPLDIPRVIRGVLERAAPDIFVTVETELWPNFIRICRQRSLKVVMVNGRLSPRSFRNYRVTRFFWKGILEGLDAAGVISETDGLRLREIGMDPARIAVLGNAKYDGLLERATPALRHETARLLGIDDDDPVIVAGSTHEGEEAILADAYEQLLAVSPGLRLVLVPRHVDRAPGLAAMMRDRGFQVASLADIEGGKADFRTPVIVVDIMGRLFGIYSVATVVFCGGSLVPRGGQNVLEAAAWGKVILHGPSMDDFREEGDRLDRAGAAISVENGEAFVRETARLLADSGERRRRGEAGRMVVEENRGAAERYALLISEGVRGLDGNRITESR